MSEWWAVAVGALTGILSGFGIGGGSLLLLYLTMVEGISQWNAGGINLFYFLCCAPAALVVHIRQKRMEWQAVKWALWGVLPCLGTAWVASVLPTDWLRRAFGVVLLYIGWQELFGRRKSKSGNSL